MPRILKIAALAACALLVLLTLAVGIFAATFNPNDYKARAIALVQEKTGRTLAIPGEISLSFFPKLGAKLGQLSLSERGSSTEFAAIDSARVSLALLPLLRKQLVIDHVELNGMRAQLVRLADGSTNIDDLAGKREAKSAAPDKDDGSGQPLQFAIDGIKIGNASLHVDDRQQGRQFDLAHFNMESGEIASGVASHIALSANVKLSKPVLNTAVTLKSDFNFDLDKHHFVLKGLDASIDGAYADYDRVELNVHGNVDLNLADSSYALDGLKVTGATRKGAQTLDAVLTLPSSTGNAKAISLPGLAVDLTLANTGVDAKGKLAGTIAIDLDAQRISASQLDLTMDGKNGAMKLGAKLGVDVNADLKAGKIDLALKGKLDESTLDAHFAVHNFAAPAFDVAVNIDAIDLARYQSKAPPVTVTPAAGGAPEAMIDLSALKALNAKGSFKVGLLKVAGMQVSALSADLHAGAGKVALSPIKAKLYGGAMDGAIGLDFSSSQSTPRINVNDKLSGIKLGALLKDALKKDIIDGTGDVQLDVNTQGATVTQMRRALAGTAKLSLTDGSISGFNLAQIIRNAKAKVGLAQGDSSGTGTAADKTDFSEMLGSFRIAAGVAHNDDLSVKTPLFRLGGAGDIDIGRLQLDYLAKCTVVASLQGQGGPELQALKGLTVPVKLSGPFSAIAWHVDFKSLVSDAVKEKAKEKIKDKLKDALKGFLGH